MILSFLTLVLMVGCARFWTTIAEKEIKKIEEQDVVLPCQHRFGHLVTKNLDIEWLLQDSEPNQKVLGLIPFFGEGDLRGMVYQCSSISHPAGPLHPADYIHPFEDLSSTWQVITYSLGSVYENLSAKQRGRISFAADYMMGDASIKISSLQATDSGLYTCKVKNAGEYDWKPAINLVVLVRPSKPKCWTQGQLLQGNDVKLQCRSEKGTEPILYRWERLLDAEGQKAKFQTRSHIDSRTPEMLLLRNLSHTNSGVYQCSATNEAGQESCSVNITVTYAKDPGIIAGAVIGVMLGLLLIFLIVWFTLYRKAKHKYEEEEQPNEIREDAEAPKAKLSSTQSSVGTGSTQSGSCSVKSIRNGTPYSQQPRTPSAKEEKMLISYTSTEEVKINKNGPTQAHMKRMGAVPVMIPAQTKAFQTV